MEKISSITDCIKYICDTGGGTFIGRETRDNGVRIYAFDIPRRTWAPRIVFTTKELRFAYRYGW
jgi:hypothetical protein